MPPFWRRFLGSSVNQAAGYAMGGAIEPALEPLTRAIANDVWSLNPNMPLDPLFLAEGVVQGQVAYDIAVTKASHSGVSKENFDVAIAALNTGPGIAPAFELWRRGIIDEAGFRRAAVRQGLEQEWIDDLVKLHDVLLTPTELANARQQGFVTDARQRSESALQGVTQERADILFELSGNPPGPETLQRALNRGEIDQAGFVQAIREGRTKTKYTDFYTRMARSILSASTYVTAFLKGHITQAEMHAGGALHGYTPADMDLWYQSAGRPATVHQIHIGYARGAKLAGVANEQAAILQAVAQSDIRPEYGPLLYAQRYTYPSAFVLRGLVQSGAITSAEGEQALLFSGWEPTFAAKVAAAWAGSTGTTTADKHVEKAQTQLWGTTHRSYIAREITDVQARNALGSAGVPSPSIQGVLNLWQAERDLVRKQLTPAQVKKALKKGSRNAATGQPWTRDEALAWLIAAGYSTNDANDFLDIP